MGKFIDITGQKFGRLKVIELVRKSNVWQTKWLCECVCKNKRIVLGGNLKNGNTQSCGCLQKEIIQKIGSRNIRHGHNKKGKETRTHKSWHCMIQRCTNPNNNNYTNYGRRGITVCERWLKFENFLEDMGERPNNKSIERIKNDLGYNKKNCKWATSKEQNRNTRKNIYVTHNGKTQLLIEWSGETGIPYSILWKRIYMYNWSIQKALTTPAKKYKERRHNE